MASQMHHTHESGEQRESHELNGRYVRVYQKLLQKTEKKKMHSAQLSVIGNQGLFQIMLSP